MFISNNNLPDLECSDSTTATSFKIDKEQLSGLTEYLKSCWNKLENSSDKSQIPENLKETLKKNISEEFLGTVTSNGQTKRNYFINWIVSEVSNFFKSESNKLNNKNFIKVNRQSRKEAFRKDNNSKQNDDKKIFECKDKPKEAEVDTSNGYLDQLVDEYLSKNPEAENKNLNNILETDILKVENEKDKQSLTNHHFRNNTGSVEDKNKSFFSIISQNPEDKYLFDFESTETLANESFTEIDSLGDLTLENTWTKSSSSAFQTFSNGESKDSLGGYFNFSNGASTKTNEFRDGNIMSYPRSPESDEFVFENELGDSIENNEIQAQTNDFISVYPENEFNSVVNNSLTKKRTKNSSGRNVRTQSPVTTLKELTESEHNYNDIHHTKNITPESNGEIYSLVSEEIPPQDDSLQISGKFLEFCTEELKKANKKINLEDIPIEENKIKFVSLPKNGLSSLRKFNNFTKNNFPDYDNNYRYYSNNKRNCLSAYDPLVRRESIKEEIRGSEGLCPFCTEPTFFRLNDSHYLHHLAKIHGVCSNGEFVPDPTNHRQYLNSRLTLKTPKIHIVEGAVCGHPACNKIIKINEYSKSEKRYLPYLRHFKECHPCGKKLKNTL
ncbi:hypothetical protein PACTADRAFT_35293 [Pachysolen tannophilus NRRL Y-2460]|uniref:Transcription regulator Rua1 C-terminal domain-containing protein n=1 Tax=Pachysolen tannophilus NRRL Y-2460 TaxID=669874 RepID=A0A1E4TRZ6_PACTA|nr:hypothetical protein PACTADRAFT_35293 [Pachysolen tannophilus NRRL Y-2460]